MVAIERCGLAVRGLLPVAMLEDDLGRALDQEHLLAAGVLCSVAMNLCSDSNGMASIRGIRRLLGLPVQPELGRERIERALGRVALDLPDAFLLEQFRVVAEHRDAAHERRAPAPCRRASRPA